jgi:hypothetical protein
MTRSLEDLFDAIKPVFDAWDPECLLRGMGCRSGEYDGEIKQIAASTYRMRSAADAVTVVREVCHHAFETGTDAQDRPWEDPRPTRYTAAVCHEVGGRIWQAIQAVEQRRGAGR